MPLSKEFMFKNEEEFRSQSTQRSGQFLVVWSKSVVRIGAGDPFRFHYCGQVCF